MQSIFAHTILESTCRKYEYCEEWGIIRDANIDTNLVIHLINGWKTECLFLDKIITIFGDFCVTITENNLDRGISIAFTNSTTKIQYLFYCKKYDLLC